MSNFGQLQLHEGYLRVTRWIGGSLISTFAVRTLQEFCAMLNQRASETMKVFLALLSAMMVISITQTRDVCQLDIKTKAQFNKLPPMLLTFGADVLKAKKAIIAKRWFNDSYQTSDIQLSTFRRPQSMNNASFQNTLEVNRRILKAFIPNMSKFKRQFGAFVAARDVTHQLQEVKWKAVNIVNFIQAIEKVLQKLAQTTTAVIRPIKSTAAIKKTPSSPAVSISAQSPAATRPSTTVLALHDIALKASAMLDDLYSNIVTMQLEVLKVSRTTCPTK